MSKKHGILARQSAKSGFGDVRALSSVAMISYDRQREV
jgi:hypothetical protein